MPRHYYRPDRASILDITNDKGLTQDQVVERVALYVIHQEAQKGHWGYDKLQTVIARELAAYKKEITRTIQRIFSPTWRKGFNRETMLRFAAGLHVPVLTILDRKSKQQWLRYEGNVAQRTDFLSSGPPSPETEILTHLGGASFDKAVRLQDVKSVIRSRALSNRLLHLKNPPSLFDSIRDSVNFLPVDDQHKDKPFLTGHKYNHFLQLSALISVISASVRSTEVIGYYRSAVPGRPHHLHTQGVAILWGISFYYGPVRSPALPILQEWMESVARDTQAASDSFYGSSDCVLTKLVRHKIPNLANVPKRIFPLGVITRDERDPNGQGRVYTQYVFNIQIDKPASDHTGRFIQVLGIPDVRLLPLSLTRDDAESLFINPTTKKNNPMDIAAWRSLRGTADTLQVDRARCVRGFTLV
jgi:hypothetical protein